jgi:redox-sensing transcriptional repressor
MARDQNLPERGFRIKMIFDDDDDNIGREIADLTVQDAAEMVKMIRAEDIQIAILAVLAEEAQQIADQLVEAGIRAILNCAPIRLTTPEAIRIEGIDAAARMQEMSYYLD